MDYGKQHKTLLQTIIHEGALHEDNGKELVIRLFDHNDTTKVLNEINAQLQPLYMVIKCVNCEVTGQLYWIFANTIEDKTARLHPEFSQVELALLRNVYSEIVTSNNGYVSSTLCLNLCSMLSVKLSKADAEQFLQKMVDRKWLCRKDGKYYMGVRSLAELLQYFKDTYDGNIQICTLCDQELFYGEKCKECFAMTHVYCLENYARNGGLGCPKCRLPTSAHNRPNDNNVDCMDVEDVSQIEIYETTQSSRRRLKRRHE
ncbi:non-structural maintenance of chromosomes element 1 homolog [Monomorium pharaonis]|uniref:non-structural maintenance of chromosomes element 1 homolog n=1 Tax=Monomorium pharaonis TaxID=307658 RepID=UPI00063FBE55|nr:non-structural maintenance of chromosomes element 1 homolog [Monomorium pharaonis]